MLLLLTFFILLWDGTSLSQKFSIHCRTHVNVGMLQFGSCCQYSTTAAFPFPLQNLHMKCILAALMCKCERHLSNTFVQHKTTPTEYKIRLTINMLQLH